METEMPLTTTNVDDKLFMGEVDMGDQQRVNDEDNSQTEDSEEEGKFNFSVLADYSIESTVPPHDFDSPYSKLPQNVKMDKVKEYVYNSLKIKSEKKKERFKQLFEIEHVDAIISDSFWYVICRVFKPDQYIHHEEFFLDRIAANYVSFTLHDEFMGDADDTSKKGSESKNRHYKKLSEKDSFFKNFYNHIAQSVFSSLFLAYPKSRSKLKEDVRRNLLDIFSELFTGTQIKSASYDHWKCESGSANVLAGGPKETTKSDKPLTLADVKKVKNAGRTKRDLVHMKYSPLVERYLKSHKYETMNNVRGWKMLLTQRTGIQKEIDEKFEKYRQIADQIVEEKNIIAKEYADFAEEIAKKKAKNEAEAKRHIDTLKKKSKELMENGCAEYANMLVSLFNYEYGGNND
ncbi:unnamed protein product [Moneuplotes crassus]|uniref:Uncharacterized protein n=1 Tax=Euplotes crassus TaxID=5936 RepID=A0AAD1UT08_EUPCR|nr:unnamed protein product [Moneuplotes crassus]